MLAAGPSPLGAQSAGSSTAREHHAALSEYCVTCHNDRLQTAGLSLESVDVGRPGERPEVWEKVIRKLHAGMMPPPGELRPAHSTVNTLLTWLEGELDRSALATPDPGRTQAFHRLNQAEYQNAVRDLLALDTDVTSLLPSDDASYGFDNIAGVLKIDDSRLEQYLNVARRVSTAAVSGTPSGPAVHLVRVPEDVPQYGRIEGLPFGTRGGTLVSQYFPQSGEYDIRVTLTCRIVGTCDGSAGFADTHQLEIMVDGERIGQFTLEPHDTDVNVALQPLEVRVAMRAGPHEIGVAFLKLPSIEETESRRGRFERPFYKVGDDFIWQEHAIYQPYVDSVSITGPFNVTEPGDSPSRRRIFTCRPSVTTSEVECARSILTRLARVAYRRPVNDRDIDELLRFFDEGRTETGGFESGIELALRRLLMSPEFLYRIERDPPEAAPDAVYRVSDRELASRLSFFLWSSIPDDELLTVASEGRLHEAGVLEHQVRRMLVDQRSQALVKNFAGQWLLLRNLESSGLLSVPLFPNFDGALREGFRRETELFFESIAKEDRSVLDLLTADYTFVNERLAKHYGIPNVYGTHFRRVTLPDERRRGLLGHGSILLATSRPNRTSPVLRGKWIMENILGVSPPPPPANVPELEEESVADRRGPLPTMRERMVQHRTNPVCSSCHSLIDPLGFALENFSADGRWRDVDEAYVPIDSSGVLPDGTPFADLPAFREVLLQQPERFVATMTEKLLTYALGRGLEYSDMPAVRRIVRDSAEVEFRFSSLVLGIARSAPFLMRRAADGVAQDKTAQ